MRSVISFLIVYGALSGMAQNDSKVTPDSITKDKLKGDIILVAEQMPEFPGGETAFMEYISKNLEYPKLAKEKGIEGKVYIQFDIDSVGKVVNAKVIAQRLRGKDADKDDYCLGQCALKVVADSPAWKPAVQYGKKVTIRMRVPISFKLE